MPSRENEIRRAIENLDGDTFEKFARILVRREKFPGLRPTSQSHDKGEDSYTEETSIILHDGKYISLGASKTDELSKIKEDCDKRIGQNVDIWVFVTSGLVRRDRGKTWKDEINKIYGWDLEIYDIEWLVDTSTHPNYEGLVQDYLHIPPPGGDYYQDIVGNFSRRTQSSLQNISIEIPGLPGPVQRKEISEIEAELQNGSPVILNGDAGTGKSGIAASIAYARIQERNNVLLIDARKINELKTEKEFSNYLNLGGSVLSAVSRISGYSRITLIIDQLDNVAGLPVASLLIELACECSKIVDVEVIVVSRDFETHGNNTLVRDLKKKGFQDLESRNLDNGEVITLLTQLKIDEVPEVVELAKNLLNLKIIGRIKELQPNFNFSMILDETMLWDIYISILMQEETPNYGSPQGKKLIQEAITLACDSLKQDRRIFSLEFVLSNEQERLKSWGILREESPGQYRFQHEKMQDYFYAVYATRQQMMPFQVIEELGIRKAKNIFSFMNTLYERDASQLHIRFFREVMNVQ